MARAETTQGDRKSANPFPMENRSGIAPERYYDRAFFELEKEWLWNRTWQMACRLEEIPEANDYVEYEINDQSVLIVRQQDMTVKAFHNACLHRATQLGRGAGRFGASKIVCPFHGWQWNCDGSNLLVYGRNGFDPASMRPDDLRLRECRSGLWGGCVWINLDPEAAPLIAALQPMAGMLDAIDVGNLRVRWWKETILNANWKMAQEAFMESYHVMQTHPQLTMGMGANYPPDLLEVFVTENGHGASEYRDIDAAYQDLDRLIAANTLMLEGQDAMFLERDLHVLEGIRGSAGKEETIRKSVVRAFREHNRNAGIPMREGIEDQSFWFGADAFLFPNAFYLPLYGNALSYRVRPYNDDPEWCRFEVWSLTTYPENYPCKRAKLSGRFDKDDADNWGLIPRQDFSNIERQQRGVHTRGFPGMRLSDPWEAVIANMHRQLDRRLAGE
jgi:nitrite reductase/ring-hydroxylating ferredoxin subunit